MHVLASNLVSAGEHGVPEGTRLIFSQGWERCAFAVATSSLSGPASWWRWVFSLNNGLGHLGSKTQSRWRGWQACLVAPFRGCRVLFMGMRSAGVGLQTSARTSHSHPSFS